MVVTAISVVFFFIGSLAGVSLRGPLRSIIEALFDAVALGIKALFNVVAFFIKPLLNLIALLIQALGQPFLPARPGLVGLLIESVIDVLTALLKAIPCAFIGILPGRKQRRRRQHRYDSNDFDVNFHYRSSLGKLSLNSFINQKISYDLSYIPLAALVQRRQRYA